MNWGLVYAHMHSTAQTQKSWHSYPRWVNTSNKNAPSMHHPWRRNVTTSMVGLKMVTSAKISPKTVNPRDTAGNAVEEAEPPVAKVDPLEAEGPALFPLALIYRDDTTSISWSEASTHIGGSCALVLGPTLCEATWSVALRLHLGCLATEIHTVCCGSPLVANIVTIQFIMEHLRQRQMTSPRKTSALQIRDPNFPFIQLVTQDWRVPSALAMSYSTFTVVGMSSSSAWSATKTKIPLTDP